MRFFVIIRSGDKNMRSFLVLGMVSIALAQPVIKPEFADRLFPYITYSDTWLGTPASLGGVSVPNVLIVYGEKEDPRVVAQAGKIAYYLGQWTEDIGFSVEDVKASKIPPLLVSDTQLKDINYKNIIVVGTNNQIVKELNLSFEKPTIEVIKRDDKNIMIVGGGTVEDTIKAAKYLADVRLNFKVGAYRTFFSFVALRGYIEKGEFDAAYRLIKSPMGISACGKNMSLAAPMMANWSEDVKNVVKTRNALLYSEIPKALQEKDKEKALQLWQKAMITCYQCHQGIGIPQMRKFKPLEEIHAKHQKIAESFGISCTSCHRGETQKRGYSSDSSNHGAFWKR